MGCVCYWLSHDYLCVPGAQPRLKRGYQGLGPNTGALALAPKAGLGVGCERGLPPLALWGSGGITPGKFLKTQMLNPAFWWLLAVKFLAFWKLRPKSWGPTIPKSWGGHQSPSVFTVVVPMVCFVFLFSLVIICYVISISNYRRTAWMDRAFLAAFHMYLPRFTCLYIVLRKRKYTSSSKLLTAKYSNQSINQCVNGDVVQGSMKE